MCQQSNSFNRPDKSSKKDRQKKMNRVAKKKLGKFSHCSH